MPKTIIGEHYNALALENKIVFSNELLISFPIRNATLPKNFDQPQLRIFVSIRSDMKHHF